MDPEVVFVANLMKADAPSLVASFQCDFSLQGEDDGTQDMRANLRELKVLACPFIRKQEDKAVTTVRSHCHIGFMFPLTVTDVPHLLAKFRCGEGSEEVRNK